MVNSLDLYVAEKTEYSDVETSGHTLSFAIMLLALYPETQRKLRDEVYQIWPSLDDCAASSSARGFDRLVRVYLPNDRKC